MQASTLTRFSLPPKAAIRRSALVSAATFVSRPRYTDAARRQCPRRPR